MPSLEFSALMTAVYAALASLALLIAMFVPLERVFPARPDQLIFRPAWKLDLTFYLGQYLAWNAVALFVAHKLGVITNGYVPRPIQAVFLEQPFGLQVIEIVMLGDVCIYWYHRASHHFDFLWRFHAVHHSSEHLDWIAAHREHPIDGILTQFFVNVPAFVFGFSPRALGGLIVFRAVWAIFVHSNVRLPLGPLKWIFGAPELHHWHHARVDRTTHNFANLAPYLDVLFGTHHCPENSESYPLGISETSVKRSYWQYLIEPLLPWRKNGESSGRAERLEESQTPSIGHT